jgi:hypothetical protein
MATVLLTRRPQTDGSITTSSGMLGFLVDLFDCAKFGVVIFKIFIFTVRGSMLIFSTEKASHSYNWACCSDITKKQLGSLFYYH